MMDTVLTQVGDDEILADDGAGVHHCGEKCAGKQRDRPGNGR